MLALVCAFGTSPTLALAQSNDVSQDQPTFLGTLVLRGEKVGRTVDEVPPSVLVITGEEAAKPQNSDIDDVIDAVPNVLANEGFKPPAIRGIDGLGGDRAAITAGSQTRIPILIDDVPLPSGEASAISLTTLWDVETVEVARGPQPTSTGRNAFGGAIRVYTRDPIFKQEAAFRALTFNSNGGYSTAFMVNTPVVENQLAFRFTGEYSNSDSYILNAPNPVPAGFDPNEEKRLRLRGKVLYEPEGIDDLSLVFSVDYTDFQNPTEGFFNGNIENLSITPPFFLSNSYEDVEQIIYSARLTYDFSDQVALVARVSHLDNDLEFVGTGEVFSPFPGFSITGNSTFFDKDLTEVEAYLQFSDIGILRNGVFGVIYSREEEEGGGSLGVPFSVDGAIENIGIYGEAEVSADSLIEGLTFVAGARYEFDDRRRASQLPPGTPQGAASFSEEEFLPKLGVRYDVNEKTSVGYTYSRGFRGGGLDVDLGSFLQGLPVSSAVFGPETIDQHEIFLKSSLLDGRLNIGTSAFFYRWDDAQLPGAQLYPLGGPALGNVPEAEGYGLEIEVDYQATPSWTFSGGLGLLETEITQVTPFQSGLLGLSLPRAPDTTASLGVLYAPGNGFEAGVTARYTAATSSALGQPRLGDYTVVDLSMGYTFDTPGGSNIRVDAFVENVFDERYQTFEEAVFIPGFQNLRKAGRPRTIGAGVTVNF